MHMKWDYIDIQIKLWVRRFCLAANNLVGISFNWTSILRMQNTNKHTSTSTKSQLCVKLLWLNVKLRILTELRFNYETNIIYNCLRYLACLWFFSVFIVIFFFLYVFWSNIAYGIDQSNCIYSKKNTEVNETMVECCRYSFFIPKPASIERKCDIDSLWLLIHVNQMKLKIFNWNMYAWAEPARINAERNNRKRTQNKEI